MQVSFCWTFYVCLIEESKRVLIVNISEAIWMHNKGIEVLMKFLSRSEHFRTKEERNFVRNLRLKPISNSQSHTQRFEIVLTFFVNNIQSQLILHDYVNNSELKFICELIRIAADSQVDSETKRSFLFEFFLQCN